MAELGRARGARVIVDTSGPALCAAAEAGVFLLKPNLRELGTELCRRPDAERLYAQLQAEAAQAAGA